MVQNLGFGGWDNLWQGFNKGAQNNSNALIASGAALMGGQGLGGAGMAWMQGQGLDQQRLEREETKAEQAQALNATTEWLRSRAATDPLAAQMIGLVENKALSPGEAFSTYLSNRPKPGDPYTLGAGDIRYDANNNPIAYGAEQSPENIINNNMGATDKFYETLDADLAGQTSELINQGMNAQSNNIKLGQLNTLLQTAPQGMQGAMTLAAGNLGIPTAGLDEAQAAQAIINQLVPEQRPPGTGPMSDADLALFKQSVPRIVNQPGGNQMILETMQAINEYTIAQAEIAQRVANRQISPAEGRALQAQVPNPLEGWAPPSAAGGQAAPRLRFDPATGVIQ